MDCNVNCQHCGLGTKKLNYKISPEDLCTSIRRVLETFPFDLGGAITFIFHGGEPLLMGVDYYKKFISLVEKDKFLSKIEKEYSFQSNLLLLDEKFCDFLNEFKIRISSSFDFYSTFRNINGSPKKYKEYWLDKVKLYQDKTGNNLYIITVLSKQNHTKTKEIIQEAFYLGLNIKLNPLARRGNAVNIYNDLGITPKEYGHALRVAYKEWQIYRDKGMSFIPAYDFECNNNLQRCPYGGVCVGRIMAIFPDGSVWNCGEAFQEKKMEYYFGNALQQKFLLDKYMEAAMTDLAVSSECQECNICGGGCKLQRINGKTKWCESYKMLFDAIKKEGKCLQFT